MSESFWAEKILVSVLADRERLAAKKPAKWEPGDGRDRLAECNREHRLISDAKAGIVPTDLFNWLGRAPTPSDHTQASRAIRRLADRGLVIDHASRFGGINTKFLELTPEGEALARQLVKELEPQT